MRIEDLDSEHSALWSYVTAMWGLARMQDGQWLMVAVGGGPDGQR